jgi:hypothetical protein
MNPLHTPALARAVFALMLCQGAVLPAQPTAAPGELTAGVESVASAGSPGNMAVFAPGAFVVVTARMDDTPTPVVVGSEWGGGRVIALGHGGMLDGQSIRNKGTATLVGNSVRWLGRSDKPRVGVVDGERRRLLGPLRNLGVTASNISLRGADDLKDIDVVLMDSHAITDELRPILADYVRNGGGLLTAGLGWGWLQLNPGKSILDHPGNRLLLDAGIAWGEGFVATTAPDAFLTGPVPPATHCLIALTAAEQAKNDAQLEPLVAQTLIHSLRTLPADHPVFLRARKLIEPRNRVPVISERRPVRKVDSIARIAIAVLDLIERRTPVEQIVASASASNFPGPVPADAPRVSRTLSLDASIEQWHSTGLYAAPGQVVTVTSNDDLTGMTLRIGCHTDTLWHLAEWKRSPSIYRTFTLDKTGGKAASSFGGLIYIEIPGGRSGQVRLTIANAVAAPRFVLGKTTAAEWLQVRSAPAPWGELESRRVIVSVPSYALRGLDNPEEVMKFWDRISDTHAALATIPTPPPHPHRFVADMQISAGYMHSGYPIMTHLDAVGQMTSLARLREGSWGLLHELGHNHQVSDWTFDGTGEVTVNLFSVYAVDTICSPKPGTRGHPALGDRARLEAHLKAGAPFDKWKSDPFLALDMYLFLQAEFGWDAFKKVFAEYRDLPDEQRPKTDADRRDQWMVRFSKTVGRDLGPYFQAWGVPTTGKARDSIKDLPKWMPKDWPG